MSTARLSGSSNSTVLHIVLSRPVMTPALVERTMAEIIRPTVAAMPPEDAKALKQRVRARLPIDAAGRITTAARANAIQGRAPK